MSARKYNLWNIAFFLILVFLVQQVVGWAWLSDFDKSAVRTARRIQANRDIFSVTVMVGLRGIILTICLPWLGWLSWRRKSWIPIAGFILVLLFETGLAGALKMAVGRTFPYQNKGKMLLGTGELAFPSGHATNAVALWGYVAWFVTQGRRNWRRFACALSVLAWITVGVSSWLLRTHWPTDLLAGFLLGAIALLAVINLYVAAGFNHAATSEP